MVNKKGSDKHSSSDSLITLESLQAAVKGIRSKSERRQRGIRIGSCDAHRAVPERGAHENSTFEYFVQV